MDYSDETWLNDDLLKYFGFKQFGRFNDWRRGDAIIVRPHFDNYHILVKGVKPEQAQLYSNTARFYSVSELRYLLAEYYGEELEINHNANQARN